MDGQQTPVADDGAVPDGSHRLVKVHVELRVGTQPHGAHWRTRLVLPSSTSRTIDARTVFEAIQRRHEWAQHSQLISPTGVTQWSEQQLSSSNYLVLQLSQPRSSPHSEQAETEELEDGLQRSLQRLEGAPDDWRHHFNLATVYRWQERPAAAAESALRSLRLGCNCIEVLVNAAECLKVIGETQLTAEQCQVHTVTFLLHIAQRLPLAHCPGLPVARLLHSWMTETVEDIA